MDTDAPQLLDIEETQKQLGVGRTSVYGLIASGDLRAIKIGRRTLVPASEITRYVQRALSQSVGATLRPPATTDGGGHLAS